MKRKVNQYLKSVLITKKDAIKYVKKHWHELLKERERIADKQNAFAVSDQNN